MTTCLSGDCQVRAAAERHEEREDLLPVTHWRLGSAFCPIPSSHLACSKLARSPLQDSGRPSQWEEWSAREGSASGWHRKSQCWLQAIVSSLSPTPTPTFELCPVPGGHQLWRSWEPPCSFPQLLLRMPSVLHFFVCVCVFYIRCTASHITWTPTPNGLCQGSHVIHMVHG